MTRPLYGFLEGDTIGLLILAQDSDSMTRLIARLQAAAQVRVAAQSPMVVVWHGHQLQPDDTVASLGIEALDRIDVRRAISEEIG